MLQEAPTIASQAAQANQLNWNTFVTVFFSFLSTIATSVAAAWIYKMKGATQETRAAAVETAVNIDKIHTAVNSERTAMLKHVEDLKNEIRALATTNATLTERLIIQIPPGTLTAPQPVTIVADEPVPVRVEKPTKP